MKTNCLRILLFLAIIAKTAFADSEKNVESGYGSLASQALEPVTLVYNVLGTCSFVIGIMFLLASIIRYVDHRRNPLRTPISTVIFFLISGVVLVTLPFLSVLIKHGIPFYMLDIFNYGP